MNAKQRRKQRRYLKRAPFQISFIDSNQGSISDFMNIWAGAIEKPFISKLDVNKAMCLTGPIGVVKPMTVEQFERFKEHVNLYPKEILNSDGSPLHSLPLVVDFNVSFDFEQHARNQKTQGLAEADTSVHVLPGSVGTPCSEPGQIPDQQTP